MVRNQAAVDEPALKALGARGFVRPSEKDLQVVVGAIADQVAREINEAMAAGEPALASPAALSIDALGQALGAANTAVEARASRVLVTLAEPWPLDERALRAAGARAAVATAPGKVQLVIGPAAEQVAAGLKALIPA